MIPFLRRFYIPILVLALLVAADLWLRNQSPLITSIPTVQPGADLVILGQHFGTGQGSSTLSLLPEPAASTQPTSLQVTAWADTRITARLPQGVTSGHLQVIRSILFKQSSLAHAFLTAASGLPSQPYGYTVPVEDASCWPTFRGNSRNTGNSPLPAAYQGDQPWSFQTGKGIFSTPVIDANGAIYVGSADHYLYALNPDGSLKWKYLTGGIIDSAGALGRFDPQKGYAPLTFISGDGSMYNFRTDDGISDPAQRLLWKYQAELRPGVSYNRWFEGNVAIGPDGTLYAGNTNFNYYAIHPDGTPKWTFSTTSNNWSQSAFAADGTIYWGSLDTFIHVVAPDGLELWSKRTLGFVAASAAVGLDGTVYIGSFDSHLYALDPSTGKTKWTFPTNDHIYSSAALGADTWGNTTAIYFGSADGTLYAVSPQGQLLWKYDTGDPIRSSPAIGLDGQGGAVVYFGCGNGKLYALNDDFILTNPNFKLAITGINIPFNLFELRGRLGTDRVVQPGATAWGDTQVLSIPTFGPYLVAAGLANNWYQKLLVAGTYITRPYPDGGSANQRPTGIAVTGVDYQAPTAKADGWVKANFKVEPGARVAYPLSAHQPGILLIDSLTTEAIYLDYHANLSSQAGAQGNLDSVRLIIPKGTVVNENTAAIVMLDVFPFYQKSLCGCTLTGNVPTSVPASERIPAP